MFEPVLEDGSGTDARRRNVFALAAVSVPLQARTWLKGHAEIGGTKRLVLVELWSVLRSLRCRDQSFPKRMANSISRRKDRGRP